MAIHEEPMPHDDKAPKVKPLVWIASERGPRYERTECGTYGIFYTGNAAQTLLHYGAAGDLTDGWPMRFHGDVLGEKARKAAQVDYERRILGALEFIPNTDLAEAEKAAAVAAAYEKAAQIAYNYELEPNLAWPTEEQDVYEAAVMDMQFATSEAIRKRKGT